MPANKTINAAMTLTILVIFNLLLAGCGYGSNTTTPASATADRTQNYTPTASSVISPSESPVLVPTAEDQATVLSSPAPSQSETLVSDVLELILHGKGFGQAGEQLAYGFEIENPNGAAVSGNVFQLLAYTADGELVGSEVETIPLLLPGQLLGVAGSLILDNESTVEEILLQITTGDRLELDILPDIEITGINYRSSELYERVSGLIGNESEIDLDDIRISALAYARDGRIIGAGYTYLSFLPANSAMGVDIVLTTNEPVERIELYPRLSLPTLLQTSIDRPLLANELSIADSGYSQSGIEVGYGFLIENPNSSYALENTEYRLTFFNESGDVIAVDEGYIELLLPQEILGIGDHVFVDEDESVSRMVILAKPSHYQPAIPKPLLTAENVVVISDTLGTQVSGDIVNPYLVDLNNVRVAAIVFDAEGRIVGGGFDWIDTILPNGVVPVEVRVSAGESGTTAKLYAGISEIISD